MLKNAVTVRQIQNLDKTAIHRIGVPSLVLMENAGKAVAAEVKRYIKGRKDPRVCIVCGLGNNAGDGFVAARHLLEAGVKTTVYLIGQGRRLKHDAAVNYHILKKLKYPVKEVGTAHGLSLRDIARADVVVDAIFGVGLNRAVQEPFRGVIEAMNNNAKTVLAVDIPSGLDGTTGKIHGLCVQADLTVTFSFIKKGFLKGLGPKYTGKVVVADIGIPRKLLIVNS
jgi:NAD(P)H-hydrate epimerase